MAKYIWDDFEMDDEEESFDKFLDKVDKEDDDKEEDEFFKVNKSKKRRSFFSRFKFLILAIIVLIIILFAPVFVIKDINVNSANFVTKNDVVSELNFISNKRYNLYQMLMFKFILDDNAIISYKTDYSFSKQELNFVITELKPLAIIDDDLYYSDGVNIQSTSEFTYKAPVLIDMDSSMEQSVLNELSKLDYDIISSIEEITSNENVINTQLLLMRMSDENYVEISIKQIHEKLRYYDQISLKLKQAGKKPGIIHLNIGDYYEPL